MPIIKPIQVSNSVIQELYDPLFDEKGVQLMVKREDLIHPQVSGNKWRKLKYNLVQAQKEGHTKLLTFGGAYSNHILATAVAGKLAGFQTIGIIRGEEHHPLNETLAFAKTCGMELHYLDRQRYRKKNEGEVKAKLLADFGPCYLIPEGGSNSYAVQGCAELVAEINADYDYLCTACGTGGTMAGLIAGLEGQKKILGIPVLKGATWMYDDIQNLLGNYGITAVYSNWELKLGYHFGGYAKKKPELELFIEAFQQKHLLAIEFVYTGKLFFGIYDLIKKDFFERGTRIMAIHTGGLRDF
ncbi:MAG: 1-aminocyclopropane-1-carboxylate deaminase/D-cysteine desulfhydrase [Flammeovirgaceae bacterium]